MFQAQDARVVNLLANDPDILPFVVPQGTNLEETTLEFDHCFEPERAWRFRYFHNGENDGDTTATIVMMFQWSSPDVWEMHMLAKPEARGGPALAFAKQTVAEMFNNQGAKELWGQTPVWNKPAVVMHHKVGGIPRGTGYNDMFKCDMQLFATSKSEWLNLDK